MLTKGELQNQNITCPQHGVSQVRFVCQHLVRGQALGFFHADCDDLRPDAWCLACEQVLVAHGGEWDDEAEAIAGVTAICTHCYDKVRQRNEVSGKRLRPQTRPTLEEDGWELDSAVRQNQLHPDKFHIPSQDETRHLKLETLAKLIFLIAGRDENGPEWTGRERMWVKIDQITPAGYQGRLVNQPTLTGKLKLGDRIEFTGEHVASTFIRKDDPRHPINWKVVS